MLTVFGSTAVAIMLLTYWLEPKSRWYILGFAVGCAATAVYGWLTQVYPIAVIEAIWTLVAVQRFVKASRLAVPARR